MQISKLSASNMRITTILPQILTFLFLLSCSQTQNIEFDETGFKTPPSSAKVHIWWHWMNGNITEEGITKDLEAMHSEGVVQATILNVGFSDKFDFGFEKVLFGSDEWYKMFQWALSEAKRLDISIGIHNCDGWSSSGGPWVTPEKSMKQFVWTKTLVSGGQKISQVLRQPLSILNFYKDVSVVAYKTNETVNTFHQAKPELIMNETIDASNLIDGNPVSGITVKKGDFLTISSKELMHFDKITICSHRSLMWGNKENCHFSFTVLTSADGKKFNKIKEFTINSLNKTEQISISSEQAKYVRILFTDFSYFGDLIISELELLKNDESPLFLSSIPNLPEKTVSAETTYEKSFYTRGDNDTINKNPLVSDVVVLTDKMNADGTLNWEAPDGKWVIIRFGYTTTGSRNNTGTREGRGLECDKMDTTALNLHFRSFPEKLIEKAGTNTGNTFKFLLLDSWECGFQNWTDNFPSEFEKRRGYDLISYLPVLCGQTIGSVEESEAVLYDFRQTIADLIKQNYYEHFSQLCHQNKLQFHAEVIYGNSTYPPLDILKATQCIDVPMYEYWVWPNAENMVEYHPVARPELNLPSCAAIGYNKQVVAAEAYTGKAHYSESPVDLKPFGDRAYCAGINQFILHSYVHQPTDQYIPGLTLERYASHFNRNNLYWPYIFEWLNYQSRIQYVLQQGVTVSDVLYYLGDQFPQYYQYNQSTILPFGYQINACNYDILKNRISLVDGKLCLTHNTAGYALLSLPAYPYMNMETLQRIEALVKEGAVVYGPKPLHSLGKIDLDNIQAFHVLADQIWGADTGQDTIENNYGKGKVFWGMPVGEVLRKIGLPPDFTTNKDETNTFQFIHKKAGNAEIYFVTNQQNVSITRECLFRVTDKIPEIWDPEDGSTVHPAIFRYEKGQIRIPVTFGPLESKLFIFKSGKPADYITTVEHKGKQLFPGSETEKNLPLVSFVKGKYDIGIQETGDYTFITNNKKSISGHYIRDKEAEILNFTGSIRFGTFYNTNIPAIEMTSLHSLTEYDNPDIRFFSGDAHYQLYFETPEGFEIPQDSILLDIGDFGSVARVTFNGKQFGDLWKPGTKLNISGLLKPENTLDITVANVYRNRFIGDFVQFGDNRNLRTSSPIEEFLNKNSPLKSSGLMGPIRLIKIEPQFCDLH